MRGIFFDEDDAIAVAARLVASGYDAQIDRERLAGEDDDEGHPWAVLTDAPEFVLDVLVDEHDGWLDHDEPGARGVDGPAGEPLPRAPQRFKKPQ